jgi:G6PDH family F420-dependent oxidoreductase
MLEEAVQVIRMLWEGGVKHHRGRHYTLEHARLYSLPDEPPPIHMSGFGPRAIALAARTADGYITTAPDAGALAAYRREGGRGSAQGGMKVCWAEDEAEARRTAHRLWPNDGLPGELAQVLPAPAHFEQASTLVTEKMIAESIPCGPDPERHAAAIQAFVDAGFDEIYVQQIGPDQGGFLRFYERKVLSRFA